MLKLTRMRKAREEQNRKSNPTVAREYDGHQKEIAGGLMCEMEGCGNMVKETRHKSGGMCSICWNKNLNLSGDSARLAHKESAELIKYNDDLKAAAEKKRLEELAEQERLTNATISLSTRYESKCSKCGGTYCKEECHPGEPHMRHAALHAIQSYLAIKRGGTYDINTGLNRPFGDGFVNCTYSADGACRCLMPKVRQRSIGVNARALPEPICAPDRLQGDAFKFLMAVNPSVMLRALAIVERLLMTLEEGPMHSLNVPAPIAELRALMPTVELTKALAQKPEGNDGDAYKRYIERARFALASFADVSTNGETFESLPQAQLDVWNKKERGQIGQWCAVSETMGDVLVALVGIIWIYLDAEALVNDIDDKQNRDGLWHPIVTSERQSGLRILRDYLLRWRVFPCFEKMQGDWAQMSSWLGKAALAEMKGEGTAGLALALELKKIGISKRDFDRFCFLAHADRLLTLFKGKPGAEFISKDAYNQLEAAAMSEVTTVIDEIVAHAIPRTLTMKGQYAVQHVSSTTRWLALADFVVSNDTVGTIDAAVCTRVDTRSDVMGGTSLNYITVLFGHDSMQESTISKGDFPKGHQPKGDLPGGHTSAGFNTSSRVVTQVGFLRALAKYGNALFTAQGQKEFRQQSNWQIGSGVAKTVLTGWQATSGPAGALFNAASNVSTGMSLGGVGAGLLKNVISTVDEGMKLDDIRNRNKKLKKRIDALGDERKKNSMVEAFWNEADKTVDMNARYRNKTEIKRQLGLERQKDALKGQIPSQRLRYAFTESTVLQGANLFSSMFGVCSSAFTLSVGIAGAVEGASLAAVLATGAGLGAAIPIVGWSVVGLGIAIGIGIAAYQQCQLEAAKSAMREFGLLIDAKDSDDVKVAEACVLIHAASLIGPDKLQDPTLAATVFGLQSLLYLLFADFVTGDDRNEMDPTEKWNIVRQFAASAGPEGLFDTWRLVCPNLRRL